MEDIKKLQELLDLIKDKADSTPAEKLVIMSAISERYKEIFDTDMLLERIMWQSELDYIDNIDCDDVPF